MDSFGPTGLGIRIKTSDLPENSHDGRQAQPNPVTLPRSSRGALIPPRPLNDVAAFCTHPDVIVALVALIAAHGSATLPSRPREEPHAPAKR